MTYQRVVIVVPNGIPPQRVCIGFPYLQHMSATKKEINYYYGSQNIHRDKVIICLGNVDTLCAMEYWDQYETTWAYMCRRLQKVRMDYSSSYSYKILGLVFSPRIHMLHGITFYFVFVWKFLYFFLFISCNLVRIFLQFIQNFYIGEELNMVGACRRHVHLNTTKRTRLCHYLHRILIIAIMSCNFCISIPTLKL